MKTYAETTYAETEGEKPFDWNAFLAAKIEGRKTEVDDARAEFLSGGWVTCACGNLCAAIPRRASGAPKDPELCSLGAGFHAEIAWQDWTAAKEVLALIEARSSKLLKQLKRP